MGIVLSVEERSGLELAFTRLRVDENLDNLYFWGKIMGQQADYFIAYTLIIPEVPKVPCKQFYFWYIIMF